MRKYKTEPQIWDDPGNCVHEWETVDTLRKASPGDVPSPNSILGKQMNRNGLDGSTIHVNQKMLDMPEKARDNSELRPGEPSGFCAKCGAWKGHLGLEPTIDLYVKHLCDIFDEVRRVLRDDGTCFVNMGDSYGGSGGYNGKGGAVPGRAEEQDETGTGTVARYKQPKVCREPTIYGKTDGLATEYDAMPVATNIPSKCLCMVPERFAIEMINRGWILRDKLPWIKALTKVKNGAYEIEGSCMPASVTDRFTSCWEPVYFFSKSKKYWFERQFAAVKEQRNTATKPIKTDEQEKMCMSSNFNEFMAKNGRYTPLGANLRGAFMVNTSKTKEKHFACVDSETECLTSTGWKTWASIKAGDRAMQFDVNTGALSWGTVQDVATYNVKDNPMIAAEKRDLSMMLTENHRTIILKDGKYDIKRADELISENTIPISGNWNGKDVNQAGITGDFIELLGWYAAEGCKHRYGNGVDIYQSVTVNGDKVARIEYLLKNLRSAYQRTDRAHNGKIEATITIHGAIATQLKLYAPTEKKKLTYDVLQYPVEQLTRLFAGLIGGDGHTRVDDGRFSFIQKSRYTSDLVQAIGVKLGYATQLTKRSDGNHIIYFTRKRAIGLRGTNGAHVAPVKTTYTGVVWCPKLPLGTFVARRRGRVFMTGNTYPVDLCVPFIRAGCPKEICTKCGLPRYPVVKAEGGAIGHDYMPEATANRLEKGCVVAPSIGSNTDENGQKYKRTITYTSCTCGAPFVPGIVLDPFFGTGTTAVAAIQEHRQWVGCELSPEYIKFAEKRLSRLGCEIGSPEKKWLARKAAGQGIGKLEAFAEAFGDK